MAKSLRTSSKIHTLRSSLDIRQHSRTSDSGLEAPLLDRDNILSRAHTIKARIRLIRMSPSNTAKPTPMLSRTVTVD